MSPRIVSAMLLSMTLSAAANGAASENTAWSVGDDRLQLQLARDGSGRVTETCRIGDSAIPYVGSVGAVQLEGQAWQPLGEARVSSAADGGLVVQGSLPGLEWRATYERSGPGMVTKTLVLEPSQDILLQRVAPAAFSAEPAPEVASTGLQDIAAFVRNGQGQGIFVSLDFPASRITTEDGVTRVSYPAFEQLLAGQRYECHSLTLGATQLSGETRYGRDTGEVEAMDRYVQSRYPQRFDRPMFVSACINNRYTQPRGGVIWYTYKDHPTLSFNLDLMKRELDLMPQIGMEYYQVFPGIFDWVEGDPDPETVREIMAYGNERGVRIGDYSGCNSVFCGHYNEYGKTLDRPEWRMQDAQGNAGAFCFGCPDFVDFYTETVVSAARDYGFELHCMDFLSLAPCHADHGHPAGDDSIYHQVKGLVRFMNELADVDPDMMVWSNSGNWAEFLPKIAWWNPNLYLTDPFIATPWQGLNMTRLLDDARREQMVSLHYTRFMPYRHYTNCQYFFSQNSIVPDIRNYPYGALSSIAVTPNLCLAEIRPWMDRLPAAQQEEVKAFYQKWTQFLIDNFDLWKTTYHIGDNPGPGGVEVYSHTDGNHGFVFIVNPNYWSETVEVPLDKRLGFSGEGSCEIRELHPVDRLLLTSSGPTPAFGESLTMETPAQLVRVLEVKPAERSPRGVRVYGIPADIGGIGGTGASYLLRTSGPQGTTHRFAVRVPDGAAPITSAEVRPDVPRQAKRLYAETPLNILGQDGPYTLFEITYRRTPAPTELRQWQVQPGDAATGESQSWPQGFEGQETLISPPSGASSPLANFCGAYIDNAFGEEQETVIALYTGGTPPPTAEIATTVESAPTPSSPADTQGGGASWWLRTDFHLPFMYTIGAEPAFDEHTILVFPMVDPSRVRNLRAWVNGVPLDVHRYAYPRNRGLFTWWADLVGSGARGGETNVLVVHVEFVTE